MATPSNHHSEHPSTYVVQDRSNEEELKRLQIQDHLITTHMGGVLPEQPDPARFQRVLDVGCGTGDWLIEAAKTYPTMKLLVGVDVSRTFVEYARIQAEACRVDDRVEFQVMDALRMLEFPTGFFDLVNLRFGVSWLRTWDWPKLLQEFQRVARAGGVIRISERGAVKSSSSAALLQIEQIAVRAFSQAGYFFAPHGDSVIDELARLLNQHGLQQVQTRAYALEFRGDTDEGQSFAEDYQRAYRTIAPFLQKWTCVPDNYEDIYQEMVKEMHQPDCVTIWNLLTVWGTRPPGRETAHTLMRDR
ncbi:MAG TPA: class I SAM-dependent methyltransferase [Ktedonobacteraceae bacterium]|nr:class I SAM-dependent methyltransferase [Ktedonobacteraceae bacterium]